jgi:hypothetical protein
VKIHRISSDFVATEATVKLRSNDYLLRMRARLRARIRCNSNGSIAIRTLTRLAWLLVLFSLDIRVDAICQALFFVSCKQ